MNFRVIGLLLVTGVALLSWLATCAAWRYDQVVAGVVPLDPRHFERLVLFTVGTGGAWENPNRRGPASAVAFGDRVVLIDAGRGVAGGLRGTRIPVSQPDTVFLSSLLPENTTGLDDLLVTGWQAGRSAPLRLVGPVGTKTLAEDLVAAHRSGIEARAGELGIATAGAAFDVLEIGDGWSEERDGLRVRAGALPGGPVEGLAWRLEADGRSLVVGGPGWAPDALSDFARGANLLVQEAVFVPTPELARELGIEEDPETLRRLARLHTSIDQVGHVARRAGVETLVLVRLRPPPVFAFQITSRVDDDFDGRIRIPQDGDEITP